MQSLTNITERASNNRKALDVAMDKHYRAAKMAERRGPASKAADTVREAKTEIGNLNVIYQGLIKEARAVESSPEAVKVAAKGALGIGDQDGYIFLSAVFRTLN